MADLNISDILASITRPSPSSGARHSSSAHESDQSYTDHILLTRAWQSERCTSHLLPYAAALITRVMSRIASQITKIEDMTSGVYDNYDRDEQRPSQANLNLVLSILQTDLSRTQFLVRSYLRCRLQKITTYAVHYLKYYVAKPDDPTPATNSGLDTKTPLLSLPETQFLKHHQALLTGLYSSAFLSSLPVNLRRLDDNAGGIRMDEGPDLDSGTMFRCLVENWSNEDEVERGRQERDVKGDTEKATILWRTRRGDIGVGRWRDLKEGILGKKLELL